MGSGCGERSGSIKFVCKRDYGAFVPLKNVILEKDFDGNPGKAAKQEAQGTRQAKVYAVFLLALSFYFSSYFSKPS